METLFGDKLERRHLLAVVVTFLFRPGQEEMLTRGGGRGKRKRGVLVWVGSIQLELVLAKTMTLN